MPSVSAPAAAPFDSVLMSPPALIWDSPNNMLSFPYYLLFYKKTAGISTYICFFNLSICYIIPHTVPLLPQLIRYTYNKKLIQPKTLCFRLNQLFNQAFHLLKLFPCIFPVALLSVHGTPW